MVHCATRLFFSVLFPGFFGQPFAGCHPLHIFIADIKDGLPVSASKHVRRDTGTARRIRQCFGSDIGPRSISLINHTQPVTNAAHGVMGDMADKQGGFGFLGQFYHLH